jgi:phosphoheptose isomerase
VLFFGNGGSAADAQHLASELVGRFVMDRPALTALALTTDASAITSISNDYGFDQVFARQIEGLGKPGDVALAISTSGRSANVLLGVKRARECGLTTIGLTGGDGGQLADLVDIPIIVPSANTARIQECHITIGHILCEIVESAFFGELESSHVRPQDAGRSGQKVVDWDTLLALREQWRVDKKMVVWTNGCFDLLHLGHVQSLRAARALGDILVVGVNSDDSVRQLKGPGRPVFPASDRVQMLAALGCVDHVIIFEELTPEKALVRLKPEIHCKGANYAPPHGEPVLEAKVVEAYGGRVEFLPFLPGHSTSEFIQRIQKVGEEKDGESF